MREVSSFIERCVSFAVPLFDCCLRPLHGECHHTNVVGNKRLADGFLVEYFAIKLLSVDFIGKW